MTSVCTFGNFFITDGRDGRVERDEQNPLSVVIDNWLTFSNTGTASR